MMKFFIVMAMLLGSSVASAENKQITSPDGKLVVTVSDVDGRPSYSVSYDNVLFLKPSPLGMIANIGDFSSGMSLEKNVSTNKIDETYELASIKQSKVRYVANEAVFSFTQQGKTIYDVIFRISNNDVAFKYKMYPQGEALSCVIRKEATGFAFPDGTTTRRRPPLSFVRKVNRWGDLPVLLQVMRRLIQQMMSQGKMAGEKDIHFPVYFVMEIMVGCLFPKRE